jgi:hypothetical protein
MTISKSACGKRSGGPVNRGLKRILFIGMLAAGWGYGMPMLVNAVQAGGQRIDLAEWLAAGKLRPVNRSAAKLQANQGAVHVDEKAGPGVVWIEGSDFSAGTIEADIRGRDVFQKSFVGIAFHRKDDETYEAVYLRPFNFRASDPARHKHAVQYIAAPQYDWPRLREEFPDQFESAVDASAEPSGWVHLRIVIQGTTIQVYAGSAKSPTLSVRTLGQSDRGLIGLWAGNNSDGDFANFQINRAAAEPKR